MKKTGTWAEVNLDNLKYNIKQIKNSLNPDTLICGVVKADAYGHGAVEIANILEHENVDYLSVARIEEGIELRQQGITTPILCMGATNLDFLNEAIINDITLTVFNKESAILINEEAKKENKVAKIHIKINTGMNRIGFYPDINSVLDIDYISKLKNIDMEGIFTHFAKADEYDKSETYKQLENFKFILKETKNRNITFKIKHVSNSASILDLKELGFNMVRAGIAMYGMYPSNEVTKLPLKPLLKLKTKVVDSKIIKKGDSVSYGYNFTAKKDTQIVTLSIGYADGFPRTQTDGVVAIYNDGVYKYAKIVGNICMDQCMAMVEDLEIIPIGSEVSIIDELPLLTAEDLAKRINTINYEITCMISRRVSRIYKINEDNKVINYLYKR